MKYDLKIIADAITKETQLYLKNMDIEYNTIENDTKFVSNNYLSSIDLSNNAESISLILSMDQPLFKIIFDKLFTMQLALEEKIELENELTKEISNTIVGLAIQYFPKEYADLVLQPPINIEDDIVTKLNLQKNKKIIKIDTNYGCLYFLIIAKD